jgi:predicted nucleotidyltransferase
VAESASATNSEGAAAFAAMLDLARRDDNILAFWLGGSRGKGRATVHSDYDVALVVREAALAEYRARHARVSQGPVDCVVFDMPGLEAYAAWGAPSAWDRYSFAHVTALVDKTGEVQALIDAKASVPAAQAPAFIAARLDHAVNQIYRSAKCLRDGDPLASRLEAAEGVQPLLDVAFALHGDRLRPFPKYLAWELDHWPLERLPWPSAEFLGLMGAVVELGSVGAQQTLLRGLEPLLRGDGYGRVIDAWGASWTYIRGG